MNNAPKFSVIIPTCGRDDLLMESVESVLVNTYQDFEIIVIDQNRDESLRTRLEATHTDPRIIYARADLQSASRARNNGIELARGETLVFLDDDATVEPGWLQAYAEALENAPPEVGALVGRILPKWGAEIPQWMPDDRIGSLGMYDRGTEPIMMPETDQIVGANFAILRDAAVKTGPFNEDLGPSYARSNSMLTGEDSLYSIRVVETGHQIRYIPAALAHHYVGARKLRFSYFLRRYYWEGFTYVSVRFLAGSIRRDACDAIIKYHVKNIFREWINVVKCNQAGDPRLPGSKTIVGALCESAKSLGVIKSTLKLRRHGKLP